MMKNPVIAFLHLRRRIRDIDALEKRTRATIASTRRAARQLDAGTPFDKAKAQAFRNRADKANVVWRQVLAKRDGMGRELLDLSFEFDLATTLHQRCELLNINVAHRAQIERDDGLVMLLIGHALEDSAARERQLFNDAPMFNATVMLIVRDMDDTPEGRAVIDQINASGPGFEVSGRAAPHLTLVSTSAPTIH